MRAGVSVFVVFVAGCSPAIRGDGTLAVLQISAPMRNLTVEDSHNNDDGHIVDESFNMEDAYCVGAHLWDVAGAQVRCEREIGNRIAVSSIRVDVADAWEESLEPGSAAWYLPDTSMIRQAAPQCATMNSCAAEAAHEIGHALGMQHLKSGALMSPNTDSESLTEDDLRAFRSIWN